jgi:hypothetical protein
LVETDCAISDNWWITSLPSGVDPAIIRLARRGHRKAEVRDHIKSIRRLTGRFGRFSTRHAAFGPALDGDRPNGRDRHPGVDTPLRAIEASGPVFPLGLTPSGPGWQIAGSSGRPAIARLSR